MRCFLMSSLPYVLNDMLQNPHYFPISTYDLNPKPNSVIPILSIRRHRVSYVISHCQNPSKSVSPIGISVSPRWDCNLTVYVHCQTRSHQVCAIGTTEITMQILWLAYYQIGPTEFV